MKWLDGHRLKLLLTLSLGAGVILLVNGSGIRAAEEGGSAGTHENIAQIENVPGERISNILKSRRFAYEEAEKLKRTHFHNYIVDELPVNPNPAFCFVCHGHYPHANAKMTRSILNMHTIYLACESCHFRFNPKDRAKYGFRWFDGYDKIQGMGRHYGTEYDRETGRVIMKPSMTVSKITPYKHWEGKFYMVNLRMDAPESSGYLDRQKGFTPAQQAAFKTRIHTSISTKGRECGECHAIDSVLNFRKLGFDEERVKDLTGLNIVGMVSKYQKFYIPDIFKQQRAFESPLEEDVEEK